MLMILNLHSFSGYENGSGILQILDFFRETLCICAVDVFLIISGYFGIKWKFKSFWNLVFQIFFYAFGVYIVAAKLGVIEFNIQDFIMNAKALYASWGFVTGYLLLYFYSPFLNAFSESSNSRTLLLTIIILLLSEWLVCRDHHYLNYGVMYLIGRFLHKTNAGETLSLKAGKGFFITSVLMTVIVLLLYYFTSCNSVHPMQLSVLGYNYAAPLVILQSIFLFLAFYRWNFQSKFINWLSASTLSIFLIHMHPSIKEIGYYGYTESLYNLPVLEHIGKLTILILTVFFGSILIDKVRIFVSNAIYSLLQVVRKLMPDKLFQADTYIPKAIKNII